MCYFSSIRLKTNSSKYLSIFTINIKSFDFDNVFYYLKKRNMNKPNLKVN